LGIFKCEKQEKCNGHFAVCFPEDARQSDQNQQQKQCPCRVFIGVHGKRTIYCGAFFCLGAPQRKHLCHAFLASAHGKGRHTQSHPGAVSCFFLPCAVKKRTAKIIYPALSDATHD
jgi:hypothetical protein